MLITFGLTIRRRIYVCIYVIDARRTVLHISVAQIVNASCALTTPGGVSDQWRRNYGDRGGYIVPPKFRTCTPCTPQIKDAAYVKILSKRL